MLRVCLGRRLGGVCLGENGARFMSTGPKVTKMVMIGGGRMAEALAGGVLNSGKQSGEFFDISIVDPQKSRRELLTERYGVNTFANIQEAGDSIPQSDLLVLAVKPQQVHRIFEELDGRLSGSACTTVSVVAGLTMDAMKKGLQTDLVCRTMPNTPVLVGQGMTVWIASEKVSEETKGVVGHLLGSLGEEVFVTDENILDQATAVSGSGPAYFLLTMESMVEAAVHIGLPRDLAMKLVKQTALGTAELAKSTDTSVVTLRNDITSPGGTTSHALYHLNRGNFQTVISDAVWAAYRQSRRLGNKNADLGPKVNR